MMVTVKHGRPRDPDLDEQILAAAAELLAEGGIDALTFAAVAQRAGTTRPAIYRRHPDRTSLAVAAIASLAAANLPAVTGDFRTDLSAELFAFRRGITRLDGLGVAGAVLSGATDPQISETYRREIVGPRRRRIAALITAAVDNGELTAGPADQKVLVTMCTGSWYGFGLAGTPPPRDWPRRTANLVWAAGGGNARNDPR